MGTSPQRRKTRANRLSRVKRYRGAIKAEQIRQLVGALVLNGHTTGMFVTTSTYQPGALAAAKRASSLGAPIELMDAEALYAALRLSQHAQYETFDNWLDTHGDLEGYQVDHDFYFR